MAQSARSRHAGHVLTLEEIANLTAVGGDPAETLKNVAALIAKRFKTDVCSAYLLEPDRANLVLAATLGLRPQCVGTLRMSVHEGLAGLVAESVRPVASEQAKNHPRFKHFTESGEDDYQSFLGVPVIDRGVLQGVLVVQTTEPRVFHDDEIRMLTEAAAQVAPVVSEARTLDRFIAPAMERLWSLARNLWWSWDADASSLFRDLDPVRWRQLNHNPVALLGEIPLAEIERRATRTGASRPHQLRLSPPAGVSRSRPNLGRALRRHSCARARWRTSPRNSGCMNPFRFTPAASACCPEITSKALRTWEFRSSESAYSTGRDIFDSTSMRMAGSRKRTSLPKSAGCLSNRPSGPRASQSAFRSRCATAQFARSSGA